MFTVLAQFVIANSEPPHAFLNVVSGLLRFYPFFLKASMLLHRFVQ